jgi:3-phytase
VLGNLFIAEEDVGIWKYGAEPDSGDLRTLIARVGEHGLAADVEGLALYKAAAGKGYLLASSQGNSTIQVYERDSSHPFVLTIDPVAATAGDVDETDGLEVTNRRTTSQFPRGLLVLQDGKNRGKNQNFKLFSWEEIAGGRLRIDPDHPVRPR